MTPGATTRHLGLDLGATNIKWAVLEHDDGTLVHARPRPGADPRRPTPTTCPATVVGQLVEVGADAIARCGRAVDRRDRRPGPVRPGDRHDPVPRERAGPTGRAIRSRRPVADAVGAPAFLINDARAFGLAELRLGAGRGARSMIGLTLGTGVGGVIAIDGRVHQGHDGTAGEIGHQTIDPDGPLVRLREPWLPRGVRPGRPDRRRLRDAPPSKRRSRAARAGDARAMEGLAQIGRYLGIGIANMIVVLSPDRVVIGGGISAAVDLLLGPLRDELRRRVRTTSLDEVEIVTAELGTWAGAIGAAIHGAEAAAARRDGATAGRPSARGDGCRDDRDEPPAPVPPDRAGPARADLEPAAGRAGAVRRRAVRRVRGQPDDGAARHAAARRGWPDQARAGTRQLRRAAAGPSAQQPPDDVHPGDDPGGTRPELAGADPRHPSVVRRRRPRAWASRSASRSSTCVGCGWRTASRSLSNRPS